MTRKILVIMLYMSAAMQRRSPHRNSYPPDGNPPDPEDNEENDNTGEDPPEDDDEYWNAIPGGIHWVIRRTLPMLLRNSKYSLLKRRLVYNQMTPSRLSL